MLRPSQYARKEDTMAWIEPEYPKSQVKKEGHWLRGLAVAQNTEIIKNWRSSHGYPLNHFYITLKSRARKVNANSFASQRLKRLSSIYTKLRREPAMQLNTMQDIAGCRAIMPSIDDVAALVSNYKTAGGLFQHQFDHEKDYLACPKPSGYRSHHLVYRYSSASAPAYNGMRVEIQIRSSLQHAWATAVETIDLFTRQALKSSQGSAEWERFFVLMSNVFAEKEKTEPIPGAPIGQTLINEIRDLNDRLEVSKRLLSYKSFRSILGLSELQKQTPELILLKVVVVDQRSTVDVTGYNSEESDLALADYYAAEADKDSDAVLVSTARIRNLKRAFPNYFANTDAFIRAVEEVAPIK